MPKHRRFGAGGPGGRAGETLEAALAEIAVAIQELRELAQGVRPSQLDAGLGPALEDLAGRVPLAVVVDATPERFPVGVEAAAYFTACEGLTTPPSTRRRRGSRSAPGGATAASSSASPTMASVARRRPAARASADLPTGLARTAGRCGLRASAGPAPG